ncbi:MAG: hypothetical protein ACRD0G_16595 [Acidimicrobiales bacterium]
MPRLIVIAALALLLAAAACSDDPAGYDEATEAVFLEACTAGLTRGGEAVCSCAYDAVTDRLTFEEYEALDRDLRDDPEAVPTELQRIVLGCEADVLRPPTSTTTSTTEKPGRSPNVGSFPGP